LRRRRSANCCQPNVQPILERAVTPRKPKALGWVVALGVLAMLVSASEDSGAQSPLAALPFLTAPCVDVMPASARFDRAAVCQPEEGGALGSIGPRTFYYALYCTPMASRRTCGGSYGDAVTVFERAQPGAPARPVIRRVTPFGETESVYGQPSLQNIDGEWLLTLMVLRSDGRSHFGEYYRWRATQGQWRSLALPEDTWLANVAASLRNGLVPRRVWAVLPGEHSVLVDVGRPGDTPADAVGLARVETTIEDERFVMGSVTVEPPVDPRGRIDLGAEVVRAAWSTSGSCVALATGTEIHVADAKGRVLWRWRFRDMGRFMRPQLLAASASCDTVAVGGDSSYRFVWLANRSGQRFALKTAGTPRALAFALGSEALAVSTAAPRGYFVDASMTIRWSGRLGAFPIRWPSAASTDAMATLHRSDVEALLAPLSSRDAGDDVSDDGEWRVAWHMSYEGPPAERGRVEFWGPGAGGFRARWGSAGRPRWSVAVGCASAELSSNTRFVIVHGDRSNPQWAPTSSECLMANARATYVFDRDGRLQLTVPAGTSEAEAAEAVARVTGESRADQAGEAWDVNLGTSPNAKTVRLWSQDSRWLLIGAGTHVRIYQRP